MKAQKIVLTPENTIVRVYKLDENRGYNCMVYYNNDFSHEIGMNVFQDEDIMRKYLKKKNMNMQYQKMNY